MARPNPQNYRLAGVWVHSWRWAKVHTGLLGSGSKVASGAHETCF